MALSVSIDAIFSYYHQSWPSVCRDILLSKLETYLLLVDVRSIFEY